MIEIHKINEVYVRIICDYSTAMDLKDYLSCYIPNYKFHPKVKRKIWDGKISFFDVRTHELPIGLLPMFDKFCKHYKLEYKFMFDISELCTDVTRNTIEAFTEKMLVKAYTSENEKIDAYDYQIDAVVSALNNKRGVLQCVTSSGKSLMLYLYIRFLLEKIPDANFILVVPSINLVSQLYSDFEEYGWDDIHNFCTQMCTGYNPDFKKQVLITTWQSLMKKPLKFFEKINVLMVDECHNSRSLELKTIAQKCINAQFRLGTTGTLPIEESERMNIFGFLGQIIYTIGYQELMSRDIISKIQIVILILKYPKDMVDKNKINGGRSYPEEKETCNTYENRNSILKMIIENSKDENNTLILAENLDHLDRITTYLEKNLSEKYMIVNIDGRIKTKERENIRKKMETEKNMILIASYGTFSVGVSVKRIHNVIFASSYKAKIKVLQSIGRGLRKHKSKVQLLLFDIVDNLTWVKRKGNVGLNHIYKHYIIRKQYYKEHGFNRIVKEMNI